MDGSPVLVLRHKRDNALRLSNRGTKTVAGTKI
jgi:hypothetical protein